MPWIFEVIPIMDVLTATLNKYTGDKMLFPTVCSAATQGHEIINKYYSLMDDSIIYRIAMVLHPSYKTIYFQCQKWPDSWVDTAVSLVCKEWGKILQTGLRGPTVPAGGMTHSPAQ
ncbi:hypothetical protein K439DRAFT_1329588 [Ramaria rubella]|nr:hypothetical protein K439DRAFT_1329588 [Ramaria rubella]